MIQNIFIGIGIYIGGLMLISLFLQGCTRNDKAFEKRKELEILEKEKEA